ncbi:lysylphosphatidylglycerol synthase domain-containing protein [soil metagenome]
MAGSPHDAAVEAGKPSAEPTRRVVRIARLAYLVLAVLALGWLVFTRRGDIGRLVQGARPALVAAALGFSTLQLLLNAAFWGLGLRALGQPVAYGAVLSSSCRSLLARYLPGSVWYAVGRSALLAREGVPKRALGVVAVLESGLSIVVGFALGVGLLLGTGRIPGGAGWVTAWCVVLVAACSPPAVNAGLRLVARRRGGEALRVSWGAFCALLACQALFWVVAAACFAAYVHAFPALDLRPVVEVAGSFMVAWVIGFLAIFAPQGLGVFEATVTGLITDRALASAAVVVAGFRVVSLVRDIIALAIAEIHQARITRRSRPGVR